MALLGQRAEASWGAGLDSLGDTEPRQDSVTFSIRVCMSERREERGGAWPSKLEGQGGSPHLGAALECQLYLQPPVRLCGPFPEPLAFYWGRVFLIGTHWHSWVGSFSSTQSLGNTEGGKENPGAQCHVTSLVSRGPQPVCLLPSPFQSLLTFLLYVMSRVFGCP